MSRRLISIEKVYYTQLWGWSTATEKGHCKTLHGHISPKQCWVSLQLQTVSKYLNLPIAGLWIILYNLLSVGATKYSGIFVNQPLQFCQRWLSHCTNVRTRNYISHFIQLFYYLFKCELCFCSSLPRSDNERVTGSITKSFMFLAEASLLCDK